MLTHSFFLRVRVCALTPLQLLHNELIPELPFVLKAKMAYQASKGLYFLHSSGTRTDRPEPTLIAVISLLFLLSSLFFSLSLSLSLCAVSFPFAHFDFFSLSFLAVQVLCIAMSSRSICFSTTSGTSRFPTLA
nr:Serine/threonine protein kinase [Pandoravirus aubagnensis]